MAPIVLCQEYQVIMDVENHLYARKDIKQLGIASMTSMFSCGNTGMSGGCDLHPSANPRLRSAVNVVGQTGNGSAGR